MTIHKYHAFRETKQALLLAAALVLMGSWVLACSSQPSPAPGVTAAASPGLAAAQSPTWERQWNELVAGAKKDGKITVYSSANPATRNGVSAGFKEKYGIDVEFVAGKGEELVARLLREHSIGIRVADVMVIGASTLMQVKPSGALEPVAPSLILPEVLDAGSWMGNKLPLFDKEGQIITFLALYTPPGIINTTQVKQDRIKSYYDLLSPEWKSKMAMGDPTVSGNTRNWVAYMMLRGLGAEKGKDFLDKLIKQEPTIIRDDRLMVEWVARGKYPLGIGPTSQAVNEMLLAGAPLQYMKVMEGGYITPGGGAVGLFRQRPGASTGVVFVNWLLSREGQTIFSKNYGAPSSRVDVPVEVVDPGTVASPGEKVFIADEQYYLEMAELTPTIKEMFGPLLSR